MGATAKKRCDQPKILTITSRREKCGLGNVITLLSKSAEMFASSKTEQKRRMLGFVFSNLQMEGSTLRYALRKPFEVLQQVPRNQEWRPIMDETWHLCVNLR
jgi:hypothetical protein